MTSAERRFNYIKLKVFQSSSLVGREIETVVSEFDNREQESC